MSKLPSSKTRLRLASQYVRAILKSVLAEASEEFRVSRRKILRRVLKRVS